MFFSAKTNFTSSLRKQNHSFHFVKNAPLHVPRVFSIHGPCTESQNKVERWLLSVHPFSWILLALDCANDNGSLFFFFFSPVTATFKTLSYLVALVTFRKLRIVPTTKHSSLNERCFQQSTKIPYFISLFTF